jgi:hypothetical protein
VFDSSKNGKENDFSRSKNLIYYGTLTDALGLVCPWQNSLGY